MSNEVELKLAVTSDAFDTLKTHLNQFKILEQNTVFLGNTYFDYPDHFLAKQKMGLRIRQENNDFTLTLKTDGKVVGGLHSRPEYNLSIPDNSVPQQNNLPHCIHLKIYLLLHYSLFSRQILTALFG